ncbi:hypothetical protein GCM10010394_05190 [Streptomyces crystallinus]|uniref:Uncharacterized protein n=1 Tax=Streptomyces crystallinus TaxID=68191 RepID=A0ABN1F107_9ACTN
MGLSFSVKLLIVLAAALVSVIVGMLAGMLARLDGNPLPARITRGTVAFGGSLTLLLLVLTSLGLLA